MTRRRKVFWAIGTLIAVAIVATAVASRRGPTSQQVRLETVAERDLVAIVRASGKISPKTSVDIASDITGRVVRLHVAEGDVVQRNQLLLEIDRTQFEAARSRAIASLASVEAQALQAKVNRDQAKRAFDRTAALRNTDTVLVSREQMETVQQSLDVAEAVLQSQEHQVAQAQAFLREAEDQLSKTTLRAPMAGRVTRLAVEEGEVALASTFSRETGLLMTISDLATIQVDVRVDETEVVRLSLNDSAAISIDAFPDSTFTGRITRISQSAIQAGGAASADQAVDYDVEITMDRPPVMIRPDLSASADIVTETRTGALSVPIIALTLRAHSATPNETTKADSTEAEVEGVFIVRGGRVEFRPVRVGIAGQEHFEVLGGLTSGDTILAGPYQVIRDIADSALVRPTPNSFTDIPKPLGIAPTPSTAGATSTTNAQTPSTTTPTFPFVVQVAALRDTAAVTAMLGRLRTAGYEPWTIFEDQLHKIRVGGSQTRADARNMADQLRRTLGGQPFVVALDSTNQN